MCYWLRNSVLLSLLTVALPITFCAATNIVSRPVGFIRVSIPENEKSLVSIPFKPFDPSIESVLSGQLTGSETEDTADTVIKWNPSTLKYEFALRAADGKWLSDFSTIVPSEMTLKPGEGFFIWNRQSATQDVFLAGEVVLDASNSIVLVPPLNLIGSPYSASITNSSLPGVSSNTLVMSKGYWYDSAFTGATVWVEVRPYADAFPAEGGLPAISGLSVKDGNVVLTICSAGEAGEKYEIYYQDYSATNQFNSYGWQIAETNILVNGRTTLEWTDTCVKSQLPLARYYLVGRSDVDLDNDGIPDSRKRFACDKVPVVVGGNEDLSSITASGIKASEDTGSAKGKGRTIHVNCNTGDDSFDGLSELASDGKGPKRTVGAATRTAVDGDTILVHGGVYMESVNLSGRRVMLVGRGTVIFK